MKLIESVAAFSVPALLVIAGCFLLFGKRDYWLSFTKGAWEGIKTAANLLPTLVLLLAAISMLRVSGATALLASFLRTGAGKLGIPSELLPLLLTRPFSGSASGAMFSSLLNDVGADSFPGLCAAVIMGSSDTVVYVISVCFSAVGIKKTSYALPVSFAVMIISIVFSCFLCRLWFK